MNTKKEKRGHLLLYLVIAIIVLLSLIVLPLADTDHPDSSQSMEEGALAVNGTVTGSALTVDSVTGSAINVDTVTGGAIDVENPKKDDPDKLPKKTVYDYEDDNIIVKAVFSDAAAVPDHAKLIVTPITEATDSEQYSEVEDCINDSIEADNKTVTSFLAYDIYFLADGVEYEPELGVVNVTLQYKNEILEDSIKKVSDEIKVLHLKETAEGIRVEDVTQEVSLVEYDENNPVNNADPSATGGNIPSVPISDSGSKAGSEVVTDPGAEAVTDPAPAPEASGITESDSNANVKEGTDTSEEMKEKAELESVPEMQKEVSPNVGTVIDPESEGNENAGVENTSNNMIKFTTNSFSTFVVTGISAKPVLNVTMRFINTDNSIDTSISGTYYLNITGPGNMRYNLPLKVVNGSVTAQIPGLYDQNGNKQDNGNGALYPLAFGSYTTVLFKDTDPYDTNSKWDSNKPQNSSNCEKFELGGEIYENYFLTEYTNILNINSSVSAITITAKAKSGLKLSNSYVLAALTPVIPYSIFASQFDLFGDMEGCIAVQRANLSSNFGNTSNNRNSYGYSTVRKITVSKTYRGTVQKSFKFGLFKDNILKETLSITLPAINGSNTATASFSAIDPIGNYDVYELDSNNIKLEPGDKYDGYTLISRDIERNEVVSTINTTSYIETILSALVVTSLKDGTVQDKNRAVLGSDYTIIQEGNNICAYKNGIKYMSAPKDLCNISAAPAGSFPIKFDEILSDMSDLSVELASAISTDTIMVKSMTIAELNNKKNQEFHINTGGRLLILNIDATDKDVISLSANAKLVVNGESCGGWSQAANNIVVNIFTKRGGKYYPYAGSIRDAGYVMGILLVPRASVNSLGQDFNGNIIAKYVTNEGKEVHGNTLGFKAQETIYRFVNVAETGLVLPMTGGFGTRLFYYLGAGIILLGMVLNITYCLYRRNHPDLSG